MAKLNPPILEAVLPAFAKASDGTATIRIPFQLNRSVGESDIKGLKVLIKSVQSNTVLYSTDMVFTPIFYTKIKGEIVVPFSADSQVGQYYKIQIAFLGIDKQVGFYSNVATVKCISKPTVKIVNSENLKNTYEYIGSYSQQGSPDTSEKVYSYKFNLYDNSNNLISTSGEKLHNTSEDTEPDISYDKWIINKSLEQNQKYLVEYEITTINGYSEKTSCVVIEKTTQPPNVKAKLSVSSNFENGYNTISLIGNQDNSLISGSFVLMRSSTEDNYSNWNEICRFKLLQWDNNLTKEVCRDYCLRQGHEYKYALQAYNNNGLYSDKMMNIEGPVLCDFEDCFLYDGEKQLKIRFNPKIGSFKSTVLESKMDTLGGKYPFIFRNGNVEYKEFSVSGLLSLLSDDNGDFFNTFKPEDSLMRSKTPAAARNIPSPFGTLLTAENYRLEREFKTQALEWLTNGKPKLFRSPAEGNFIVRLMNTSLSPNDTLGRLLHTFTSTAYEIAEYNYENLKKYNFAVDSIIETREMSFAEIDLVNDENLQIDSEGFIILPKAELATITANPNIDFNYKLFNGNGVILGNTNLTGVFIFPREVLSETPLIGIKAVSSWGNRAKLVYGYYNEPDTSFSLIKDIKIEDKIIQQSGLGININLIEKFEDIRIKVGAVHYLGIQKKVILPIQYNSSESKYYLDKTTVLTVWNKNCLYEYEQNDEKYYINGDNPPSVKNYQDNTYYEPNLSILIPENSIDTFQFILNNSPTIDFSGRQDAINTFGRQEAYTNLGEVFRISAGPGIILNIVYQEKEILYSIEDTNDDIKRVKKNWLTSKDKYEEALVSGNAQQIDRLKEQMDNYYLIYLNILNKYLERETGGIDYAI